MPTLMRTDSDVWTNENYVSEGFRDYRIPFLIYDKRFAGERYNKFSDVRGNVVDLGCSHKPFPWANFLVEYDPFGSANLSYSGVVPGIDLKSRRLIGRVIQYDVVDGRSLYVLDISKQQLPFGNESLDYAYASHVLEHLDNPTFALNEILRTSRRGCIRFPGRTFELLYGRVAGPDKVHKWMIELRNNVLTFRRMTEREMQFITWRRKVDDKVRYPTYFPPQIAAEYLRLEATYDYPDITELFWNGRVEFKIID